MKNNENYRPMSLINIDEKFLIKFLQIMVNFFHLRDEINKHNLLYEQTKRPKQNNNKNIGSSHEMQIRPFTKS